MSFPFLPRDETLKSKLEYVTLGGENRIRYLGYCKQSVADAQKAWAIRRFSYTSIGGSYELTEVQFINGVAWSDRASLPWLP